MSPPLILSQFVRSKNKNKQWSYCWKSDQNSQGSSLHVSRGSLHRSVQGLKTRRTSSNCWISFFKVSLSLFMLLMESLSSSAFSPKKKLFKTRKSRVPRSIRVSIWGTSNIFPCLNLVCHIAYLWIKDIRTAHFMKRQAFHIGAIRVTG